MGGRTWPLRLEVARLRVGAVVFFGEGLRGQGHRESETAGTLSLPRPIELNSNTAVFCALKHTRSSYKAAIYMDSRLSFDASSEVYGGEDLALAVGSSKLKGGRGSVFGEGVKRAGSQRERDGGDSFLATTDTSTKQQYRTVFCPLKHTRSSYKPAIFMDSGLSFDASSEVYGGEDLDRAVGKWQA